MKHIHLTLWIFPGWVLSTEGGIIGTLLTLIVITIITVLWVRRIVLNRSQVAHFQWVVVSKNGKLLSPIFDTQQAATNFLNENLGLKILQYRVKRLS